MLPREWLTHDPAGTRSAAAVNQRVWSRTLNLSQRVAFNTALLIASRVLVTTSGLVGIIVSTRYLGRVGFGEITTAIVFVTVFGFVSDAGLWTVTAREIARRPEREQTILDNVFTIGILLSVAAVVVTLVAAELIYPGSNRHYVRLGIVILAGQFVATAPGGVATAYTVARQQAIPWSAGAGVASLAFLICLAVTVVADLGFVAIAASYAVVTAVNLLVPFGFVVRRRRIRLGFDYSLWRRLLGWALVQGSLLAAGVIYLRVDTVLLSVIGTNVEVAQYGLGYRVIDVLILGPTFVMTTLFPQLARSAPHSERLRELTQGAWSAAALAAVPVLVLTAGLAPEIVQITGGHSFHTAAPVLEILCVSVTITFFNAVLFNALIAQGQQAGLVRILVVILALNVALNVVLIPLLAARGTAVTLIVTEGALLVIVRRLYARFGTPPRIFAPVRLACAGMAVAAIVATARFIVDGSAADPIPVVILTSAAAASAYGVLLHVLRAIPPEVREALRALRQPRDDPQLGGLG